MSEHKKAAIALRYARLALASAPTEFDRAVAKLFLGRAIRELEAALPLKPDGEMFFRRQV